MVSAAALLFGDAARKKLGNVPEEPVVHADLTFGIQEAEPAGPVIAGHKRAYSCYVFPLRLQTLGYFLGCALFACFAVDQVHVRIKAFRQQEFDTVK